MIDVHCHLVALPTPANGCRVSKKMTASPLGRLIARRQGLPLDDPETANRLYLERLSCELSRSRSVEKAVLLAIDGVYGSDGRLDEAGTDFLIANDLVLDIAAARPEFLAGVSINPKRRDAIEELERCAGRGAVLVKTLPNSQVFDPADPAFRPYYRRMAALGIPLLSHIGFEFSLIGHDQSLGDAARLAVPLEEGVTVIAAHGCSNGVFLYEKHFTAMRDLARRFERFFVDLSALTLPNRVGALLRLRRMPELFDRLLFGTDYPVPCFSYPALLAGALGAFVRAGRSGNYFDRHAAVLEGLGVRPGADPSKILRLKS